MGIIDITRLFHPALAVAFVFPLIGMVVNFAWQTRQRRLKTASEGKSKIPPVVGPEHLKYGRWLTGAVVGISLLGLTHPTVKYILRNDLWGQNSFQVTILALLLIATAGSLICLYLAKQGIWATVFAVLTGLGVLLLGFQDKVFQREGFGAIFRRDSEWYASHFYFGMVVTLLMIFSLAIVRNIYQDRSNRWRNVHVIVNCIALLLFLGQAMTGARDLLEIPLSWQEQHLYQCDFTNRTCPQPAPPPSSHIVSPDESA